MAMTRKSPNPKEPVRSGGALPGRDDQPNDGLVPLAVARAKEGDATALEFLYIRYATEIQRYVASFVGNQHEAEDITQDVFLKLMRVIGKYTQRDVPFVAWLRRVARNAALDHLRSRRMVPVGEVRGADDNHEQVASERARALRDALGRLPHEQREVLVLRHLAGLRPREIARVVDKTEAAVHGLHHRGRRAFKATLRELEAMPQTK
jgi:RNA polymerase sigma-70 factor (ECF subfamily)